jgi:hypothetical protein
VEKPVHNSAEIYNQVYSQVRPIRISCFPTGTPVLTLAGARSIESVRPGDRVLSQHLETGELTFQPVQATTLRPPAPLLEFKLGSNSLRATRGHPFWVVAVAGRWQNTCKSATGCMGLQEWR